MNNEFCERSTNYDAEAMFPKQNNIMRVIESYHINHLWLNTIAIETHNFYGGFLYDGV